MKVCGRCGDEIGTRDGDNLCRTCDDEIGVEKRDRRRKVRARRRERADVLQSLGLVKVRGAMGGTYWE